MTVYVSVLLDPRSREVRYVGGTAQPGTRVSGHVAEAKWQKGPKALWLEELRSLGLRPLLVVIDEGEPALAVKKEREWIEFFRQRGAALVNHAGALPLPTYAQESLVNSSTGGGP
jgi:hypothetical protein